MTRPLLRRFEKVSPLCVDRSNGMLGKLPGGAFDTSASGIAWRGAQIGVRGVKKACALEAQCLG